MNIEQMKWDILKEAKQRAKTCPKGWRWVTHLDQILDELEVGARSLGHTPEEKEHAYLQKLERDRATQRGWA
jgi:hypothetical protein